MTLSFWYRVTGRAVYLPVCVARAKFGRNDGHGQGGWRRCARRERGREYRYELPPGCTNPLRIARHRDLRANGSGETKGPNPREILCLAGQFPSEPDTRLPWDS